MPLIIVGPGVPCNHVVGQPVQLLDLAPTLLDLTGMEKESSMVGDSLVPLLNGQETPSSPVIISEQWWEDWVRLCARTSRYKLIWNAKGAGGYEFYDLEQDPGEQVNLQGHAPELEERLVAAIHRHTEFVRTTQTDCEHIELDQAVLDRLVALGYVEGM